MEALCLGRRGVKMDMCYFVRDLVKLFREMPAEVQPQYLLKDSRGAALLPPNPCSPHPYQIIGQKGKNATRNASVSFSSIIENIQNVRLF
jgi:hypothetical protein